MRYSKAWRDEYVRELTAFPGSKFDDQLDSISQALEHLKMKEPYPPLSFRQSGPQQPCCAMVLH
jgi:hypothetical protein